MPRFFNPPTIWKPFSAFSMGVVQGDGRIVHLKGQVPLDRDGQVVGQRDMHAQVRKTLENIRDTLVHVGGDLGDVLSLTHYVTDIRAFMATREVRQLTFGEGSNESPAFAPNGRHVAFTSTRAGKKQIFTISRTGTDLKQLTRTGNNEHPDWSAK